MSAASMSTRAHPLTTIRNAIAWARAKGHRVSAEGALGAHCTSSAALVTWERDRDNAVSPIGAALLMVQPQVTDVEAAAALALDVPAPYVEGLGDGIARKSPGGLRWKLEVQQQLYKAGFTAGLEVRALYLRPEVA